MAKMVKRILEQESAIRIVLSRDRKVSYLVPTWQDVDVLQSIDKALSPLSSLTDILSGEGYVTISTVLPMLQLIESSLLKEEEDDTELTKEIKRHIINLRGRYPPSNDPIEILYRATFLDPRFKSKPFRESETEYIKDLLLTECETVTVSVPSTSCSQPSTALEPPPTKKKNLGSLFKQHEDRLHVVVSESDHSTEQQCREEMENYLITDKLDFEEDPLAWWRSASLKYSILAKMARKYLCVCATSSPSERVFSRSGNIVSPLRATMSPHKVDMLTFLSKNL